MGRIAKFLELDEVDDNGSEWDKTMTGTSKIFFPLKKDILLRVEHQRDLQILSIFPHFEIN